LIMKSQCNPLVSIVMTTFNGEAFLSNQIDSLLRQTYTKIEIIICDDASTDRTVNILKHYAEADDRITLILGKENVGTNLNLERGINAAKGVYIAISDQDDIWLKDKISNYVKKIGTRDLVYSDSILIDADGISLETTLLKKLLPCRPVQGNNPYFFLLNSCVSGHALMIKRDVVLRTIPFSTDMYYDEQLAVSASLCNGIFYLDQPMTLHRMHRGNQSNKLFDFQGKPTSAYQDINIIYFIRSRVKCCLMLQGKNKELSHFKNSYRIWLKYLEKFLPSSGTEISVKDTILFGLVLLTRLLPATNYSPKCSWTILRAGLISTFNKAHTHKKII
jgi:glycosyltransferase involved in cell wall biosynthesis